MAERVECPHCSGVQSIDLAPGAQSDVICQHCRATFGVAGATIMDADTTARVTPTPPAPASAAPTSEQSLAVALIGQTIGGCRIESKLGQGGMGIVYKAHHLALDIPVALKILPTELGHTDQSKIDRFVREARAAARLQHPNIVSALNIGNERGVHFIIMEFVEGESLQAMLNRCGKLRPDEATRIIAQICTALDVARKNGIVHRDIKPDNILITPDGIAKLADLGLAKTVDDDGSLTGTGLAMGTPHYMAPEQTENAKTADHQSDVYALGCTFYRMVCGVVPYMGASLFQIMNSHVNDPVPDPQKTAPEVPLALANVIRRMMAKKKDARYATTRTVLDDLRRLDMNALANDAKANSAPAVIVAPVPAPKQKAPARPPEESRKAKAKRMLPWQSCLLDRTWKKVLCGVLVLLVVGGIAKTIRQNRRANPPPKIPDNAPPTTLHDDPPSPPKDSRSEAERFVEGIRKKCVLAMPMRRLTRVADARVFVDWGKFSLVGEPLGGRIMQDGAITAVEFSEEDHGILLPDSPRLKFGKNSFTLMTWFRTRETRRRMRLIGNGYDSWSKGYVLGMGWFGAGRINFGVGGGTPETSAFVSTTDMFNDGEWHHVAAVYKHADFMAISVDGEPQRLRKWDAKHETLGQVDGERLILAGFDAPNPDGNMRTVIGNIAENPRGARQWRGRMRDLAVWRRVLTPAEIKTLFDFSHHGENYTEILGGKALPRKKW